jgi:hypothetical protein
MQEVGFALDEGEMLVGIAPALDWDAAPVANGPNHCCPSFGD